MFVYEEENLVAVEIGLPHDGVHQRAGPGARKQLVLPVHVGDTAGPPAGHRGAQATGSLARPGPTRRSPGRPAHWRPRPGRRRRGRPGLSRPRHARSAVARRARSGPPPAARARTSSGGTACPRAPHGRWAAASGPVPLRRPASGSKASGSSCSSACTTWGRNACAWWNWTTPMPRPAAARGGPRVALDHDHLAPARAPGVASTNRPAGPAPMMANAHDRLRWYTDNVIITPMVHLISAEVKASACPTVRTGDR